MRVINIFFFLFDSLRAAIQRVGGGWGFPGKLDWIVFFMILFSLLMIYGPGGGLATIAAISVIGIPIAIAMWVTPFATLVAVPWRALYLGLHRVLPRRPAVLISLIVTLGGLYAVDAQFPRGPHPAARDLLVNDDPPIRIAAPADGRLLLRLDGTGRTRRVRHGDRVHYVSVCADICRSLLKSGIVEQIVMGKDKPSGLDKIHTLRTGDAPCPAGWEQDTTYTRICSRPLSGPRPGLSLHVEGIRQEDVVAAVAPGMRRVAQRIQQTPGQQIESFYSLNLSSVQHGVSRRITSLRADTRVAGLFGLEMSGIIAEDLHYGPRSEARMLTSLAPPTGDETARLGLRRDFDRTNIEDIALLLVHRSMR